VRESTLRIMARIDALYLEDPCSGSRRMVDYLAREGIPISRDRARNLMRRMGLRAIYRKPRTTIPGEPAERFPCLVDLKEVSAVDQVPGVNYVGAAAYLIVAGHPDPLPRSANASAPTDPHSGPVGRAVISAATTAHRFRCTLTFLWILP
jgi:hypothetical protein